MNYQNKKQYTDDSAQICKINSGPCFCNNCFRRSTYPSQFLNCSAGKAFTPCLCKECLVKNMNLCNPEYSIYIKNNHPDYYNQYMNY
jgi:hypothetical protein